MFRTLFFLVCFFTSPSDRMLGDRLYHGDPIERRFYTHTPLPLYLDYGAGLWAFHEEGWALGLGYEREVYFGVRAGRLRLFAVDHTDYSGREYPIREGVDP